MRSHEERIFLATAGGRPAEASLRGLLRQGADLRGVLALAAAQGVAGSVARLLRGVGGIVLSDDTVGALKELERAPEFRMRYFEQRLREILRRLDVAGFDVLVAGRAALAWAGYGSFVEMALEEAVLEVGDVSAAGKVLLEAGFTSQHATTPNAVFADSTAPAMQVQVRLRPRSDLWARAEHVIGLPPRVRIPGRVDRLLEASRQKPGWRALRDVAVILAAGPFEWERLTDRRCYDLLVLARDCADQPVPDDVLARLRPSWWRRVFTGAAGRAPR